MHAQRGNSVGKNALLVRRLELEFHIAGCQFLSFAVQRTSSSTLVSLSRYSVPDAGPLNFTDPLEIRSNRQGGG
jgi:hypothetical protein